MGDANTSPPHRHFGYMGGLWEGVGDWEGENERGGIEREKKKQGGEVRKKGRESGRKSEASKGEKRRREVRREREKKRKRNGMGVEIIKKNKNFLRIKIKEIKRK